jgi:hypothetical protein
MGAMSKKFLIALVAFVSAAGCQTPPAPSVQSLGGVDGGVQFPIPPPDNFDPFSLESTPPAVATRMHSCQKIPYATLGNFLASRGVNLNATAANGQPKPAGQLYREGAATLGAPDYATRSREATQQTTSGATKLMDVFLIAAPEIISKMPTLPACTISGTPTNMFDPMSGDCTREGILCLTGAPVSQAQIDLCNELVHNDVPNATGQQIAVAAILSAAHTCE